MAINYIPLPIPDDAEDLTFQVGYLDTQPAETPGGPISIELEPTSTLKPMQLYTECYPGDAYVTWLNSKGCWDYWLFGGEETFGYEDIDEKITSQSLFGNYPNKWNNAKTFRYAYSKQATKSGVLRSQGLTKDEIEAIAPLIYAIQAQRFNDDGQFETILIDFNGVDFYRNGNKINFIEFDYEYSINQPIQSQ